MVNKFVLFLISDAKIYTTFYTITIFSIDSFYGSIDEIYILLKHDEKMV